MLTFLFGMMRSKAGAIGALVVTGVLLLVLGVQTARLAVARSQLVAARGNVTRLTGDVAQLEAANASAQAAIGVQAAALEIWRSEAEAAKAGWDEARAAAARFASQAGALRAELDSWRQSDYENPECRALLETDLAGICPGHARGVRNRANRLPRPDG